MLVVADTRTGDAWQVGLARRGRGELRGGGQDVEGTGDEHLIDAFELAAQDLVTGENRRELAVDGGDGVAVARVGSEGGDTENAVLEGDRHGAGGDGVGGASQRVDDVAVVCPAAGR